MHNTSSADVEMPDFAISHLPLRQPNVRSAGMNQGVGVLAKEAVVGRFTRQRDRIGFSFGAISPAIKNDQNERFRTRQYKLLAFQSRGAGLPQGSPILRVVGIYAATTKSPWCRPPWVRKSPGAAYR